MLEKLKNDQRKARRGGWHDNIAAILFGEEKQKTKKRSDVSYSLSRLYFRFKNFTKVYFCQNSLNQR